MIVSRSRHSIRIDMGLGKLASRSLVCKQDIQLFVRAPFDLGQAEVGPDEDEKRCAAPEEARLSLEIPSGGILHVTVQDLRDDVGELVGGAGEHDGKRAQPHAGGFGNDAVCQRPNGEGVNEQPENAQAARRPETLLAG